MTHSRGELLLTHPDFPEETAQVQLLLQQLEGRLLKPLTVLLLRPLHHTTSWINGKRRNTKYFYIFCAYSLGSNRKRRKTNSTITILKG